MQFPVSAPSPCAAPVLAGVAAGVAQPDPGQGLGGVFALVMVDLVAPPTAGILSVGPEPSTGKQAGKATMPDGSAGFRAVGSFVNAVWPVTPPAEPLEGEVLQGASATAINARDAIPARGAKTPDEPPSSDHPADPAAQDESAAFLPAPDLAQRESEAAAEPIPTTLVAAAPDRAEMPAPRAHEKGSDAGGQFVVASRGSVATESAAPGISAAPPTDVFAPVRTVAGHHAADATRAIAHGARLEPGQSQTARAPDLSTPAHPGPGLPGGARKTETRETGPGGVITRKADGGREGEPGVPGRPVSTARTVEIPFSASPSRPATAPDGAALQKPQAVVGGPAKPTVSSPATTQPGEYPQPPVAAGETAPRADAPPGEKPLQQVRPVASAAPRDGTQTSVPAPNPAAGSASPGTPNVSPSPGAPASREVNAPTQTPEALVGRTVSSHTAAGQIPKQASSATPAEVGSQPSPALEPDMAEGISPPGAEVSPRAAGGRGDFVSPANAPDLARDVAVQIAQTVTQGGSRSLDVTLQPEELGRLRISMSSEHGALAVTLQADRPETLDLIRRHIDLFAEELRRLGHGSVGFSFQHGSPGGGGAQPGAAMTPPGGEPSTLPADIAPEATLTPAPVPLAPRAGIDIRI